jgi:hypothetical protein
VRGEIRLEVRSYVWRWLVTFLTDVTHCPRKARKIAAVDWPLAADRTIARITPVPIADDYMDAGTKSRRFRRSLHSGLGQKLKIYIPAVGYASRTMIGFKSPSGTRCVPYDV